MIFSQPSNPACCLCSSAMLRKEAQVMWPRLVGSTILKKRLASCSNFIADFPSDIDADLQDHTTSDLNFQASSSSETLFHRNHTSYKVFVSTWNVGGIAPDESLDMEELLDTCNTSCDIYVFGFQEVVPLKASNVLGSDKSKVSMKWNSLIRQALNKKKIRLKNGDQKINDYQYNSSTKNTGKDKVESFKATRAFQCIISKQMVGIYISVWVPNDLRPFIRHPSVSCVGCGIMGCLGNKGSVSVRFVIHEASLCFVCSHLASGGREGDEKHRNTDVADIFSRTRFPKGPLQVLPRKILEHDQVIFLGDLNYRISLPEETTRLLVEKRDWATLLESDQLRMELISGGLLKGWQEGAVNFAPTYKYWPNSDVYYGCCQGRKVEKKRAPAWCDRIIWKGKGLKQCEYSRAEAKLSDHRPVKAIFSVGATMSGSDSKAGGGLLGSLFLSERFADEIEMQLDISSPDQLLYRNFSSFRL